MLKKSYRQEIKEVCTVQPYDLHGMVVTESANADLIAAAPDMYEALESTNRELSSVIRELNAMKRDKISSSDLQPPDYHDEQTVHDNLILLQKARGEL